MEFGCFFTRISYENALVSVKGNNMNHNIHGPHPIVNRIKGVAKKKASMHFYLNVPSDLFCLFQLKHTSDFLCAEIIVESHLFWLTLQIRTNKQSKISLLSFNYRIVDSRTKHFSMTGLKRNKNRLSRSIDSILIKINTYSFDLLI